MHKTLFTLLIGTFFAASAAVAGEASFKTLDQNGDGSISAEEAAYSETLTASWQTVDANADGMVDQAEFSAFETMEPAKMEPAK